MRVKKTEIVAGIKQLFENRETVKSLEKKIKSQQPELIATMKALDPDNDGIIWDEDNPSKGAAYVQQNKGSEVWDDDAIIEYLKKKKSRWMACSSRVFDVRKWEAEIANGNISPKIAQKFKTTTPEPSPFVRFGKIDKDKNL